MLPEAIKLVVSDLHSGQLVHVASSKGLTLYTGPNSIACTQQCQEMLNLHKFALEKQVCSIGVSSSLTEYALPCIRHLYNVSACTQLELGNIWRNVNQFSDQYNSYVKNLEHTFTKVNFALQGLQNQWQPVTEQVRFNASNIRILVQSNE